VSIASIAIDSPSEPIPLSSMAPTINSIKTGSCARCSCSILLTVFFSLCSLVVKPATYFIAPDGSDAAKGNITHPFASLNKAWANIAPGDLVYMRGGTYAFDIQQKLTGKNGTAGNLIKVWAYPGETPELTRSSKYTANLGLFFTGDYVHFKGLEITGFVQVSSGLCSGIRIENSSHNIFELLNIHHNGNGMEIVNEGSTAHTTDNLILNCDAHHNQDPLSPEPYGNSDGFSCAWITHTEDINTFRGCRSWWNTDDGFDLYQNEGMVVIENCQAFYNGYLPDTFTLAGDGNGFKLGKTSLNQGNTVKRKVTNCLAYKNSMFGFHDNAALCNIELDNNTAYQNGRAGSWSGGFHFTKSGMPYVIKNNIAYDNLPNNMEIGVTTHVNHNSWNGGLVLTDADFASVSPTGLDGARQPDGSLPVLTFLHIAPGSGLMNAGVNVGLPFNGSAPPMGAFE
jgi:hypothetical protein